MSFDKLKKNIINNKNILVTGGTGSFGSVFVEYLLENYKPRKVMVFSRDEQKQFLMEKIGMVGTSKLEVAMTSWLKRYLPLKMGWFMPLMIHFQMSIS